MGWKCFYPKIFYIGHIIFSFNNFEKIDRLCHFLEVSGAILIFAKRQSHLFGQNDRATLKWGEKFFFCPKNSTLATLFAFLKILKKYTEFATFWRYPLPFWYSQNVNLTYLDRMPGQPWNGVKNVFCPKSSTLVTLFYVLTILKK